CHQLCQQLERGRCARWHLLLRGARGVAQRNAHRPPHDPEEVLIAQRTNREEPVISTGFSMPIRSRMVGATSASTPWRRPKEPSATTTTGTGLVLCAVFGEPSGFRALSALPWSAMITNDQPWAR